MKKIKLGDKSYTNGSSPFIIAEIGANHNGDMDLARKMIDSAVDCGAHAVKFQSWDPSSLIAKEEYDRNEKYHDSPKKHFGSLKEMVERYYLRKEQHFELNKYCKSRDTIFCSTPFSKNEVDLLNECEVPFFKVASMDINNFQLLEYLAQHHKPIILSTGMSTLGEIEAALNLLYKTGHGEVALLHCISIYPPDNKDIHLHNIPMLQQTFGLPVGFSDHSIGYSIPLAAVALGACVIEKHFTTDKNLPGWDHEISADPNELRIICNESRNINEALGTFIREVSTAEENKKVKFRRSLVSIKNLKEGQEIAYSDLTSKRPGTGIPPNMIESVVGRKMSCDLTKDTVLHWDMIS